MRTDTLKQLRNATAVGLLFGIALNIGQFMQKGFVGGLANFVYIFFLLGGTFFLTGYMFSRRGRNTTNMRIMAQKLQNQGKLVIHDSADMPELGSKESKGWLYLTDKQLIFANSPDPELIEKKAIRLPLSKIVSIERFKPTAFTNDGIRLKMQKSQIYEVHVGKTENWINSINELTKKRAGR